MSEQLPNPTLAGRALAARRRTVTRPCLVCGTPMTGTTRRVTCSSTCRSKLHRARLLVERQRAEKENPR